MVQMKKETYDAAMSTAKAAWNSKPGKDKVDLGMKYLNASPLHMAALQGDLDFVKTVLEEIPQLAEAIDSRNQTPLHLASAEGHIDIVKELVSANVDTCTYQDIRGRNPLHVAVMKGHLGVVKELVKSENVADMCTSRDLGGRNPVHVAVVKGMFDVTEELLKACPFAAHERGERDQTILHMSVKHNHLWVLMLLLGKLELQELVNAKDADGNTALHLAVAKDTNVEIVAALCRRGIDVNVKNVNEHTALDMLPESKPRRGNNNTTLRPQGRDEEEDEEEEQEKKKERIKLFMRAGGALRAKQIKSADWLTRKKDSLMVVAALIATGAFQTGMTIPAGLLKGGNSSHRNFVKHNTTAFFASISAILLIASDYSRKSLTLLVVQFVLIAIAAASMGMSYAIAASATMSKKDDGKIQGPLVNALTGLSALISFIATAGVVIACDLWLREVTRKRMARMIRNWPEHTIQDSQPQLISSISNAASRSPRSRSMSMSMS